MFKLTHKKQDVIGDIFGGGGDSGQQGAALIQQNNQKAIDELKRQFNITQQNIQPFLTAGTNALPLVEQGTTARGLDQRLAEIFNTGTFRNLVDERTRSTENYLGSVGLSRSGVGVEEIANVPTSLGLQIEALLTGRATNLAGSGQNAAVGLGDLGQANSGAIAGLLSDTGHSLSSGVITDAQAQAKGNQNLLNSLGQFGGFAAKSGGIGGALGSIFSFSDPILKTNVEEISQIGKLKVYQWDWIPEAKGTLIEQCSTVGFMATDIKEHYPEFVEDLCGLDVVHYPALLEKLKSEVLH